MKRAIQVVVSLTLFLILLSWIDIGQIQDSLIEAQYIYLLIAVVIITVDRVLMGLKWKLLLRARKINISLFKATKIYYIANFLGIFLPPTVGTDLVRAYCISHKEGKLHDIIASILMERYLGFLGIFVTGLVGCVYIFNFVSSESLDVSIILIFIGVLTLLTIIGFFISLSSNVARVIKNFLGRFRCKKFLNKVVVKTGNLIDSYANYKHHKLILIFSVLLTFLEIFLVILWSYAIAIGLNISISFLYFAAFIPITLFLIRLPISLDGFGINEGSYAYFLAAIGISKGLGFSLGLINHFITILAIIPGGIFWAIYKSKNEVKKLELSKIETLSTDN